MKSRVYSSCTVITHSSSHARYADWHVEEQQRIATPVCSRPASERSHRCDIGSWAPLPQFDARCSWVSLASSSPLMSSERLCGWCFRTLVSSHGRSISIAFARWWWPCSLGCNGREAVGWRWSQAGIYVESFWGSWCGRWTVCWGHSQSFSKILSRIVR